jgi:hypothetical protein
MQWLQALSFLFLKVKGHIDKKNRSLLKDNQHYLSILYIFVYIIYTYIESNLRETNIMEIILKHQQNWLISKSTDFLKTVLIISGLVTF